MATGDRQADCRSRFYFHFPRHRILYTALTDTHGGPRPWLELAVRVVVSVCRLLLSLTSPFHAKCLRMMASSGGQWLRSGDAVFDGLMLKARVFPVFRPPCSERAKREWPSSCHTTRSEYIGHPLVYHPFYVHILGHTDFRQINATKRVLNFFFNLFQLFIAFTLFADPKMNGR